MASKVLSPCPNAGASDHAQGPQKGMGGSLRVCVCLVVCSGVGDNPAVGDRPTCRFGCIFRPCCEAVGSVMGASCRFPIAAAHHRRSPHHSCHRMASASCQCNVPKLTKKRCRRQLHCRRIMLFTAPHAVIQKANHPFPLPYCLIRLSRLKRIAVQMAIFL